MEIDNISFEGLSNVSYTFDTDKIYAFLGNHENITKLFEIMSGITKPKSGRIKLNNKKVFMLFNESIDQLFNPLVQDEIMYETKDVDLKSICEELEITDEMLNTNSFYLSSGEKKKIAFASMIAYNPDIIILDNFFSELDYSNKKKMFTILRRLQFKYNKLVIITDQDIDMLFELADQFLILENEIVISGDKYEVLGNTKLLESLNFDVPNCIKFSNLLKETKKVDIGYRDRITDLIKDVYDNA